MNNRFTLNDNGTFVIDGYNSQYPFSNFLPAVAGEWGIPLWAFYVNRGQGVVSFGVHDKNHAIAEFLPADRAYRCAATLGFRTFITINKKVFYEPFQIPAQRNVQQRMYISTHEVRFEEIDHEVKLKTNVAYFTLPSTSYAGLVRIVTIQNLGAKSVFLRFLDGIPRLIPFGTRDLFLKYLSRTLEAWMYSCIEKHTGIFRLRVDPKDGPQTKLIQGAHFNYAFYQDSSREMPKLYIDPTMVFGMNTSFTHPDIFFSKSFPEKEKLRIEGRAPCAFRRFELRLRNGQEETIYNVYGTVFTPELLAHVRKTLNPQFIENKRGENKVLVDSIRNNAFCVSAHDTFDNYLKNTYFDNTLRGGFPFSVNGEAEYYIYTRKHGDLERDYNKFKIFASFFSEGESNYRDVNQNRRVDLFFYPSLGYKNVVYFLNLIKLDGYNPLVVRGEKLYFDDIAQLKEIFTECNILAPESLLQLMRDGFYLGELFIHLLDNKITVGEKETFLHMVLTQAKREPVAVFGEGYWIDHWYYNLDTIEMFLYFFPDKLHELFCEARFMFWDDEYRLAPRARRFFLKEERVLQGPGVEQVEEKKQFLQKRKRFKNFLRVKNGNGEVYTTTLFVKLLSLLLNKVTMLDPQGIGVEMEADKPGWCDSLNGLPALFGSSLCETFEILRLCKLLLRGIESLSCIEQFALPKEVYSFFQDVDSLLKEYFTCNARKRDLYWWKESNSIKERFREAVFWGIEGTEVSLSLRELKSFLNLLVKKLCQGIESAKNSATGMVPSYFYYEVKEYTQKQDGEIVPLWFERKTLPLFLEAPVHALRVQPCAKLVEAVRNSPLFDKKLKMYRLNESLRNTPLEIGRSRVFPPGWLENESVWLHMEYKYLLEVLKGGYYKDFYRDFFNCVVCFFDSTVYGRSILENSSFIVSSAYAEKSLWGKGFVARLTGATVEMLHMWILLCLGHEPFFVDREGNYCIRFSPLLKKEFFTRNEKKLMYQGKEIVIPAHSFAFQLFSSTLVVYHNNEMQDTFALSVKKIILTTEKDQHTLTSSCISPPYSYFVREKKIKKIDVYFK